MAPPYSIARRCGEPGCGDGAAPPHGDGPIPGYSHAGNVASGNITVTTIASVANSTMAINPKLTAGHRSDRTDGLTNAWRERRCRPDMAALLSSSTISAP